jgi:hypothetical protein
LTPPSHNFPSGINKLFHCFGKSACFLLLRDQGDLRLPLNQKKKEETKDQLFNDNHLQKQNSQTTDYNSKFFFSHMASKDTINDLLPLPS